MKSKPTDSNGSLVNEQEATSSDENFLSRWSRRKREATQVQEASVVVDETPAQPPESITYPSDADMPPIESLTEDSDYSGFLSPNVSEALRKQALRKLFHSAGINVRDGLDDYDEDFTEFAKLGDIVTADIKHRLEREMQQQSEPAQPEPEQTITATAQTERTAQTDQVEASNDEPDAEEEES